MFTSIQIYINFLALRKRGIFKLFVGKIHHVHGKNPVCAWENSTLNVGVFQSEKSTT
jgi:hypothetical protein